MATKVGTISANNGTIVMQNPDHSSLVFSMKTSALAGQTVVLEVSNNSTNGVDGNWYVNSFQATNVTSSTTLIAVTPALAATQANAWRASIAGANWIRLRATAHTSGSSDWVLNTSPASFM